MVSAPGKRNAEDTKVTDALIKYYKEYVNGKDVTASQEWIINRYQAMVDELGFTANSMKKIADSIISLASLPIDDNEFLYDAFLAAGEDNNAKLIAEYFTHRGLPARYVHPKKLVLLSAPNQEMLAFCLQVMTKSKSFVIQMKYSLSQDFRCNC